MMKLFGIPHCDTVKKARLFLERHHVPFEFIDFKKDAPTENDIKRWSSFFGGLPVNTKGTTYKKLKDEFESLNEEDKIFFLQKNSSMIKRPILENGSTVLAFGFNENEYLSIIKTASRP